MVTQFVTRISDAEEMILAKTILMRACCLFRVSESEPAVSDPMTRVMVNKVVINPT